MVKKIMLNCKWLIVNFRKTIFLLFVFSTIHSQSLYELFKNDLPENHLNFFPLEFIEKSFQQDVKISPEMIYWRMKYFKQAMKDSSTVSDREEVKFAKDYILSRYEDKSLWIKKQLELTKQNYRNSDLYSAITNALEFMLPAYEFYKDFEYKEEQAPNNELYYYLLKFHTRDKGKIYYESIDYKIEWENYYSSFIKKLESRYKNLSLEDSEQDENFLSDIFEYWH
ncbi:MAG: hypothetical protein JXA68_10125, partial [Ignavibacteriales bacterium]|nr:hypothetical protein [Ignavibacteriales bacterium]